MIMVHGDNSGLVVPPKIAPIQVVVIPIQQKKEGVLDAAYDIAKSLSDFRVKTDDTDRTPGFKFSEQEMRGIPVRIEIGPKDLEAGKCVLVRRDTREKIECAISDVHTKVGELLDQIQKDMYDRAKKHLEAHTFAAHNKDEFAESFKETKGFVKAMWCGCRECEDKIKEEFNVTSRCIPFEQENLSDTCVVCGKPAKKMVYWGRAY
jgi:prolyl-tRNA synthetase